MARILGPDLGAHVRKLHESHGVVFHLENTATEIGEGGLTLKSGANVGRRSRGRSASACGRISALAESAGLAVDQGVLVDEYLRNQRARDLCGRRHRALARQDHGRADSRRALGCRRKSGPDGGAQHARAQGTVRRRALLLEPALRRGDFLYRQCAASWDRAGDCRAIRPSGELRRFLLHGPIGCCRRDARSRPRQSARRSGFRSDAP